VNNVENALAFSRSIENSATPDFANSTELLRLAANGNVGIGNNNPGAKLDVTGSIRMQDGNQAAGYIPVSDANGTMTWTNPGTIKDNLGNHTATQNIQTNGNWLSNDGDNKGIYIQESGKVIIGSNTANAAQLYVASTDQSFGVSSDPASAGVVEAAFFAGLNGNAPQVSFAVLGGGSSNIWNIGQNADNKFILGYDDAEDVIIEQDGDVGIGTSSPSSRFHVEGSIASNGSYVATIENTANEGWSNGLAIRAGQNTQSTNNRFISFVKPDGSEIGAVRQLTSSSVDYNTTSDLRLKTNIRPTTKGLNDLMQIEVKDYLYKDDPAHPQTGFIAQQVYEHYPNAVTPGGEDVKNNPWMMDYGKMTPLLAKAIQEQQALIESLLQENEALKAQIEASLEANSSLEDEIETIKSYLGLTVNASSK
jgi:hypothetical protein